MRTEEPDMQTATRWGLVLILLTAAACSKLTPENYAKVKVGMTYDEVKPILGVAANCSDTLGVKSCRWGDEQRHVTVQFAGDKAVLFNAENLH